MICVSVWMCVSTADVSFRSELMEQFQKQKSTVFAMDCIPRVLSRGQAFDALSSQVIWGRGSRFLWWWW